MSGCSRRQSAHVSTEIGQHLERGARSGGGPGHRSEEQLAPEALVPGCGPAVVHQEVRVEEQAADPEREPLAAHLAAERHGAVAERVVGDRDRNAAQGVVDDLVPDKHAQRVGAGGAPEPHPDDAVAGHEELAVPGPGGVGLGDGPQRRVDERGQTVLRHPRRDEQLPRRQARLEREAVAPDAAPVADRVGAVAHEAGGVAGEGDGCHRQRRDHDPTSAAQEPRSLRAGTAHRPAAGARPRTRAVT